jgi:hypothetical protein
MRRHEFITLLSPRGRSRHARSGPSGKFQMAVNIKSARALGLTLPQSILLVADEVLGDSEPMTATSGWRRLVRGQSNTQEKLDLFEEAIESRLMLQEQMVLALERDEVGAGNARS